MVDDTRQFGEFEIMNSIITLRKRELKEREQKHTTHLSRNKEQK